MKKLILVFCLLGFISHTKAQTNEPAVYKAMLPKFIKFYNAGATDSIQQLYDAEMQKASPPDRTRQLVTELQSQLGKLQSAVPIEGDERSVMYKATFLKGNVSMLMVLDTKGKIKGLFFQPYKEKEAVKTASGLTETPQVLNTDGNALSGSLVLPDKISTKIPLVIIVAGSGQTDRYGNSKLGINASPYRYLSNELGTKNIATFLFDKRMVGKSTSTQKPEDVRFNDFVSDLVLWVKKLKADNRFSKIIIAGHSEGSLVGMIAAEQEKVDGFISLAGAGRPIKDVLKEQMKADSNPAIKAKLDSLGKGLTVQAKKEDMMFSPSVQPYLISWMKFNPVVEIKKLSIPVLIIQGSTDVQVSVKDAELLKSADKKATLKIITGMNHVLKEAPADRQQNLATYGNPGLPLQKELIPAIVTFVSSLK